MWPCARSLTNTELALLSLVMEREMHGYEMERLIVERGMRNWTQVGFSSIYFVLRRLERAGLVASRLETAPGRGPARRVYAPTDRGRDAYAADLIARLSEPERPYPLFLQGLAGLPSLAAGRGRGVPGTVRGGAGRAARRRSAPRRGRACPSTSGRCSRMPAA